MCLSLLEMAQRVVLNDASGPKRTARVRVAVRLRPYMDKQDEKGEGACVRGLGPQTLEIVNWRNATESLQYQSVKLFLSYLLFFPLSTTLFLYTILCFPLCYYSKHLNRSWSVCSRP